MDPSDHDKRALGDGPSGGHGPTHANGSPPEDGLLRSVLENSDEVVKILDPDGTLKYASPAFGRILGYDLGEVVGKMNVLDHVYPDDLPHVLEETERALAKGGATSSRAEYRFRHKDESWRWMEGVGTYLPDDPTVRGVVVSARDITERKKAEEALRRSEERFRSTFDDAGIGMALSTPDGRYLRANRSFCELLGYSEEELLGMTFRDITHPEELDKDLELGHRLLAGEARTFSMEKRYVRKDGSPVWVDLTVSMLRGPSEEPLYSVSQAQDISGHKALEERLMHQAFHDPLTGLPNRSLLVDRLRQALGRTRRRKERRAAILFMDLDKFKGVNDSLGHAAGDLLLTLVSERLKRCLRPEDTLARFGGDEFVVLVEDVEGPEEAVRVAERITEQLRSPFVVEGRKLYARASIGIALGENRTKSPEDLLRDADTAMYRAKEESSGYSVFDPVMHEGAVLRLELENDLRRAIDQGEFVVHYQPIVRLDDRSVWGMEALVRWRHPERGLVSPDEFVPVAEESGLVIPIGAAVLEEACRRAQGWQEAQPKMPPLVLSVNISARQLARPDLAEVVEGALRRTGFEGNCLTLDVTETVYVRSLEGNMAVLDRLREMGVRVSIDDFGTGYSSLAYLKRLPADALKIDKSFVSGLGEDVEDTTIVRMVVELAHTFGMEVIAEGVETEEQAALLAETGCDKAQGYHFSRPLPPEDVPKFLGG